jgi:transposase
MATDVVKQIRKATRRKFTAEEKIRIVLESLRGEVPISELCRRHSIPNSIYYRWSKAFLDVGKNGLTRDTQRDATTDEVRRLKEENASLKTAVAEAIPEINRPQLVTDRGAALISMDFGRYLEIKGIGHILASPYLPQAFSRNEKDQLLWSTATKKASQVGKRMQTQV